MSTFKGMLGDLGEGKREDMKQLARWAESAERYDDMCLVMKELVEKYVKGSSDPLTIEERNLLSVAYKNVVGAKRASIRAFSDDNRFCNLYKTQLQNELKMVCREILDILEDVLIKPEGDSEPQVFFQKMAADYYRYLAECCPDEPDYPKKAEENYKKAYEVACGSLPETSPIRLGLALNYSVCLYEIVKQQDSACKLAKDAFDDAISKLDKLEETDYKDATLIMQLLRDNLTLWTSGEEDN